MGDSPSGTDTGTSEFNYGIDYVLLFSFQDADQTKATRQFKLLTHALSTVGLEVAVRPASDTSLLVFVRAPQQKVNAAVHKARLKDWLYGVRHTQPNPDNGDPEHPETQAEHLRAVYDMLTLPKRKGGAGITPKYGDWECVESIFPLHDNALNKQYLRDWSVKTFLSDKDFDQIRGQIGERIAFYFSFLQAYFAFLMVPAGLGIVSWALLGQYSIVFSVVNSLACLVFVEYWKRQEVDLALRWRVRGVSAIHSKRREFRPEKETEDPVTGALVHVFPMRKRLARQLLQVPFSLVSILALGMLIAACYSLEIFITEIYSGPFKSVLAFVPTVLLSALVPSISKVLTVIATRLNDYENYETEEDHNAALSRKIFVLNFVTSYLPVLLTAFVYMPFAHVLVPYLDVLHWLVRPFQKGDKDANATRPKFRVHRGRLRDQVVYFAITGQVVGFLLETVVPYLQRKFLQKYQEKKANHAQKSNHQSSTQASKLSDDPSETEFLTRVRSEAELSDYDVTPDLREMCIQFGYLSLFSPVWSLVPLFFLLNNWVELRSDFVKICIECKRPTPFRADTIGPWLDSMGFLAWVGSITSSALVYLYGGDNSVHESEGVARDPNIKGWVLLLVIFFAEHGYMLVRNGVAFAMEKLDTPATRLEKGQRYMLRRRYMEANMTDQQSQPPKQQKEPEQQQQQQGENTGEDQKEEDKRQTENITRASLEDDARKLSGHATRHADTFWSRQRGWKESAKVGVDLIQEATSQTKPDEKKAQ